MKNLIKLFKYLLTGQFSKLLSATSERIPPSVYRYAKAYAFEKEKISQALGSEQTMSTPSDFVFRLLKKEDLPACSKLSGIPLKECFRRYDAGDFCLGAFYRDKLASFGWVHQGSFYVKGMGYYQESDENIGYLYSGLSDPSYSGRGLFKNLIYMRCRVLFEKGSSKVISIAMSNNKIALNTHLRTGFRKTKTISHLTIFGVKYTAVEDAVSKHVDRKIFVRIPKGIYVI
jgi:ribosomal protein S18 acetylase RimI-like enzyme